MASFINKATGTTVIDGQTINFESNSITAELLNVSSITLVKSQNKSLVVSGSTLTYTVVITNLSLSPVLNFNFADAIPTGLTYVNNSFKINGTAQTPNLVGQNLNYQIATLAVGVTTVTFDCLVS